MVLYAAQGVRCLIGGRRIVSRDEWSPTCLIERADGRPFVRRRCVTVLTVLTELVAAATTRSNSLARHQQLRWLRCFPQTAWAPACACFRWQGRSSAGVRRQAGSAFKASEEDKGADQAARRAVPIPKQAARPLLGEQRTQRGHPVPRSRPVLTTPRRSCRHVRL